MRLLTRASCGEGATAPQQELQYSHGHAALHISPAPGEFECQHQVREASGLELPAAQHAPQLWMTVVMQDRRHVFSR